MSRRANLSKLAWLLMGWLTCSSLDLSELYSQQIRFPQNATLAQVPGNPWNPPISNGSPMFPPSNAASPWPAVNGSSAISPVGPPSFGGFGTSAPSTFGATIRPNSAPLLPSTSGALPPTANSWSPGNWFGTSNPFNQPLATAPTYPNASAFPHSYPSSVYPNATPPALFPNGYSANQPSIFGGSGYPTGQPSVFGGAFPSTPPQGSLFSNSIFNGSNWRLGNGWFNGNTMNGPVMNGPMMNGQTQFISRFFVAPRFRHSWISADDQPNALGINDSDLSLLFQIPRFLGSTQPLYMVPSFSLHLWDGPKNATADLPASAYSAFLDFGWETDPLRTFGVELGTRVGVFSDFNTFNGDSLRILGKALGRVRLTPTATARAGAFWVDRNRIKLVPAAGILWVPNADTRFDLFFPEPKLSHYLATVGKSDMWWYATGYFGGGAWTVQRAAGGSDSIDINDLRVALGLEWGRNELLRQGHRFAFFEGGYVFNRELIYRYRPQDSIELDDSFMLRAGIIY